MTSEEKVRAAHPEFHTWSSWINEGLWWVSSSTKDNNITLASDAASEVEAIDAAAQHPSVVEFWANLQVDPASNSTPRPGEVVERVECGKGEDGFEEWWESRVTAYRTQFPEFSIPKSFFDLSKTSARDAWSAALAWKGER